MTADDGCVLIVGREGQVGRSLFETLSTSGYRVVSIGRPEADLCDPQSMKAAVRAAHPNIVINAAAYTAVDRAEDEPAAAFAVNAAGAQAVAEAACEAGVPIIHFSTDYVFGGTKRSPYLETDEVAPIGVYGQSKCDGEVLVAEANPRHVILRTAWLFSPFGSNFVKTILRLNTERPELNVVGDQTGNPTYAPDLAVAISRLIGRMRDPTLPREAFGIFHAVNAGETTWHGFARAIVDGAASRGAPRAAVHPIATRDYPTKAQRPAYSVLSTEKFHRTFGISFRPWEDALSDCLDRLLGPRVREASFRPQQNVGRSE